jgi:hypothetical protein
MGPVRDGVRFPLRRWFGEVWAVDSEPDMAEVALCWSTSPWAGREGWQRALASALDR